MKLLLVGDCHGELPDIPGEEFDAVLAVGDVCGGNDEARSAMFESIGADEEWHERLGEDRTRIGDTTCINTGIHTSQVIDTSSLSD
jgi:hypothetical protein